MPCKGDIAICAHGFLGLITCDEAQHEPATAGNIGAEIWTGIQLTNKNGKQVGAPWQSRRPTIVAHSNTLCDIFDKAKLWDELQSDLEAERERLAKQRDILPAYIRTGPPLTPRFEKKGGPFDIEELKRRGQFDGVLANPPEPGNLFPPQPYESVRTVECPQHGQPIRPTLLPQYERTAVDGLFDGDVDYSGD